MKGICDLFIIVAAVSLLLGVISRIITKPFLFGVTSQAFLQLTQGLLLFAIAIGVREILRAKAK
ncbi:MAG: hypothetical protein JSV96_12950 [Candidatus Aminicenantes bacterium]|nr:MAG: hypothetical protein JSV96_12950 [Candidatus Aminicenantes bacterium]